MDNTKDVIRQELAAVNEKLRATERRLRAALKALRTPVCSWCATNMPKAPQVRH